MHHKADHISHLSERNTSPKDNFKRIFLNNNICLEEQNYSQIVDAIV